MKLPSWSFKKSLLKRLPIVSWLPKYTTNDAICDAVAGLTVGLTLIPQAIAYASLAGLGAQYGLYSAFAGSFVYIIFGTCKEINIGPTALLSLLTCNYTSNTNPDLAVLLCFLTGCIVLICGLLHLGFLVEFVSMPVVSGFTSAAALIIACSQLKGLLGLSYDAEGFYENWKELFNHAYKAKLWDSILSVCCIITLLSLRQLKYMKFENKDGKKRKIISKVMWCISTWRNAIVVLICAAMAYCFKLYGKVPFSLTGGIVPGLPEVSPPPFSTVIGNHTVSFLEMCSHLRIGIAVVPIVAILGNVAIAKAFSNGAMLDATQEMITLGLGNIAGSFFRSIPVNGSFTRSAVNNASGVRTQMGGLYTGVLVILALSLITPYFSFIPKATLSSVIICAVIFMVEVETIPPMWKSNKRDLIPLFATFIAALWIGVEIGIVIGVAVDFCFLLYFNARPHVTTEKLMCPGSSYEYVIVKPAAGLLFPAIDYVREAVAKACVSFNHSSQLPVVIDCQHIQCADYTAARGLKALVEDLNKRGSHVIFHHISKDLSKVLSDLKLLVSSSETELWQIIKELYDKKSEVQIVTRI